LKVISAISLVKRFGEITAVNGVSFYVYKGEIFGFLGPNGAGKTTTVRMITGILSPDRGRVEVLGYDMSNWKERIAARERIGVLPEVANPYVDLTAWENIILTGRLYSLERGYVKKKGRLLLNLFRLEEFKDKKVKAFSKGMRQRLSLALALLPDPDLLVLDEPTSGLDVLSARIVKDVIRKAIREGKTIFMTTHNMQDASELCNRIAIINKGRIIAVNTPENLRRLGEKHTVIKASLEPFKFEASSLRSANRVEIEGDKVKVYTRDVDATVKEIVRYAEREGIKIVSLTTERPSLEDVFVYLVGG